ncbi:hypothetical protein KSC_039930 [Ktedonobacter sp. SOSP1-52]|uniref:hypothetical protein n=1 Tax=Ktedonobacter sp. SOSP1-52 TaxID=2778366 RepID=UPI0019166BE4|nr:hypothetical protein [Ktedonobacter sp. SOSP1-52]GHO65101.1 hypothetical protein KSC_039930 [Ktedonobacter sp. SOSP1-52]
MSTQSVDTLPDAEWVFIDLIRKQLWRGCGTLCLVLVWGVLAQHVQVVLERQERWHLQPIDLASVVRSVLQACERIEVPSYFGGSIASSLHGMQQVAQDIDLLAGLDEQTLPAFLALLEHDFLFL